VIIINIVSGDVSSLSNDVNRGAGIIDIISSGGGKGAASEKRGSISGGGMGGGG
jgi:hypothetical protein